MASLDTRILDEPADEVLLLEYARTRRRQTLDALVARHWAAAFRLAQRLTRDPASAEDAAQEAFVALVRGAGSFDGRKPFGPWFRTLVLNAARMNRRSRATRRRHEERAAAARPEVAPTGDSRLDALELDERLRQLPEETRHPLVLHYYQGCTHDEVGEALGVPGTTARARVRKGVEQLREALAGAAAAWSLADVEALLATARERVPAGPVPAPPSAELLQHLGRRAWPPKLVLQLAAPLVFLGATVGLLALLPSGAGAGPGAHAPTAGSQLAVAGESSRTSGVPSSQVEPSGSRDGARAPGASVTGRSGSRVAGSGFLVTVRDAAGAALAGARVSLHELDDQEEAELRGKHPERVSDDCPKGIRTKTDRDLGATDADGLLVVASLEAGRHVRLHAERGLEHGLSAALAIPAGVLVATEIVVTPPEPTREGRGSIVVTVLTPAGPFASSEVGVDLQHSAAWAVSDGVATTDASGRFALHDLEPHHPIPESDLLSVRAPGWKEASAFLEIHAGAATRVTLLLEPDRKLSVRGRVVRTSGDPFEGATVGLVGRWVSGRPELLNEIPVGEDGSFVLDVEGPGDFVVRAWAPGSSAVSAAVAVREVPVDLGSLVLGRGAAVSGRAVDGDRQPLSGARVALLSRATPPEILGFVRAGEDGRFRLEAVAEGEYALGVADAASDAGDGAGGFESIVPGAAVTVSRADVEAGDVALAEARLVACVVGPDGTPAEGASVVLGKVEWYGKHVTAPDDGTVAFDRLAPGSYLIWARGGGLVASAPVAVEVPAGKTTEVGLHLELGGTIVGKVTGPAARLAKRNYAEAWSDAGPSWLESFQQVEVGVDGTFRIEGCVPGRQHVALLGGHADAVDVDVVAGEETRADLALPTDVGRASLTLLGSRAGRKPDFHAIAFVPSSGLDPIPATLAASVWGDGSGATTLEALAPGPLAFGAVVASDEPEAGKLTVWSETRTVVAGATLEVTLRLPGFESTGRLEGRVEPAPAAGENVRVVAVGAGVEVEGVARADGTFALPNVPAGSYRVAAIVEGHEGVVTATDVRAGETARVSLPRP